MDIFGDSEKIKALEFQIENLRTSLRNQEAISDREKFKLESQLVERQNQIDELTSAVAERDRRIEEMAKVVRDQNDIPVKALTAIQVFIRILGIALVIASLLLARSLGVGAIGDERYGTVWILYLFCQFAGLYLAGFGAPTDLRSITIFGVYMCSILVVVSASIVSSLLNVISISLTPELFWLAAINAIGVPILIYVERRISRVTAAGV